MGPRRGRDRQDLRLGRDRRAGPAYRGHRAPRHLPPTRAPELRRSGCGPRCCATPEPVTPRRWSRSAVRVPGRAAELVDPDASSDQDQPANRFPLFDGVLAVLDGLAAEFPVVLLLDDLHWADTASLHLLRFLVPGLATRPVLVVCGWRDHEVPAGSDRDELAAEIAAARRVLAAGRSRHGRRRSPDRGHRRTARRSRRGGQGHRTDGRQPALRLRDGPPGGGPGAAVSEMAPDTAQGAIRRRVARLPQPAQRVLTVAAVLGQDASLGTIRALAGLDEDGLRRRPGRSARERPRQRGCGPPGAVARARPGRGVRRHTGRAAPRAAPGCRRGRSVWRRPRSPATCSGRCPSPTSTAW